MLISRNDEDAPLLVNAVRIGKRTLCKYHRPHCSTFQCTKLLSPWSSASRNILTANSNSSSDNESNRPWHGSWEFKGWRLRPLLWTMHKLEKVLSSEVYLFQLFKGRIDWKAHVRRQGTVYYLNNLDGSGTQFLSLSHSGNCKEMFAQGWPLILEIWYYILYIYGYSDPLRYWELEKSV